VSPIRVRYSLSVSTMKHALEKFEMLK